MRTAAHFETFQAMNGRKISKSLKYSLKDGIYANVMSGVSETFMAPYALAMNASAATVGVLVSMPNLVGAVVQAISAPLAERLGSRKRLVTATVFVQMLLWIPVAVVPYLWSDHRALLLIGLYTILIAAGLLGLPAWSSMMADHIPEAERGKVFGRRNRILGIVYVLAMLFAGAVLQASRRIFTNFDAADTVAGVFAGFTFIFTIACAARALSWKYLRKMYDPPFNIQAEHRFTFMQFLRRVRKTNFGRFAIFASAMNFAANISGPYVAVYILNELHLDYLTYTVITIASTLTIFVSMNIWGRHADHVGNRRVFRLASLFLPVIPFLWVFSHNIGYLITIQIFAGFFWSGFNLSISNFIYDAVRPEKRTRCIAYFNVMNGTAIFLGSILGGICVKVLPPVFGSHLFTIFIISGCARGVVAFFGSHVREVRGVKKVSNVELFYSIIGLRPILSSGTIGND